MKLFLSCFVLFLIFSGANTTSFAQGETVNVAELDKDAALLRRDIRAEKKKLIAANVSLTEDEATKFWPVYDAYVAEMMKHNDEFYALIKEYAANQKTLTDAQASSIVKRWVDVQVAQAQTRQKFVPRFEKAVPAKKVARFFQIDKRLNLLLDLQVSSQIPLVVD